MLSTVLKFWATTATKPSFRVYRGHLLPASPRKGASGFIGFSTANRNPQSSNIKQQSKALAEKWKNLTPQEKAKYNNKDLQAKTKKERDEYRKQYVEKLKGEPNAYSLYVKTKLAGSKAAKPEEIQELFKKAAAEWKALGKQEKLKYAPSQKQQSTGLEHHKIPVYEELSARQIFNREKNGKKWSELKDDQRKAYQTKAKNSKAQFDQKFEKFAQDHKIEPKYLRLLITLSKRKSNKDGETTAKNASEKKTTEKSTTAKRTTAKKTPAKTTTVKKTATRTKNTKAAAKAKDSSK